MKKVLIFSLNYYPRFVGGAEVAVKEITDRTEDIEFHMVTLRIDAALPAEETVGNVRVHRIGFARANPRITDLGRFPLHLLKYWYQVGAVLAAHRLHKTYKFDGVWAMMAHSSGIPAGLFKTMHPAVQYLLTLQEGDPTEHIERTMRPVWPLFARAFKKADALQAISTFLLDWGRRMGYQGDAALIPNGVDAKRFARAFPPEEVEAAKELLGKKEGDVFLVTTSRLVKKNGLDEVIYALSLLPPNIHFLIFGTGPEEAELRKLARHVGVANRVRFMGEIGHEEMPLVLQACDIFIRPSRSEGMGNSFVEAMAAGLPVIATQEGGIKDFLFDRKLNPDREPTGWAVRKDCPPDIREAVMDILESPEKGAVVANAKELVLASYGWDLIAADMRALFDRLLGTR